MNHEKLKCYRQLILGAEEVARRVARWPRGYGYLSGQLNRAMASAVLNLAEGTANREEERTGGGSSKSPWDRYPRSRLRWIYHSHLV